MASNSHSADPQTANAALRRGEGAGTIRSRLGWILSGPILLTLALLSVGVIDQSKATTSAADTSAAVDVTLSTQELVHYLQRERGLTNGLLGGTARYRFALRVERTHADAALATLRAQVDDTGVASRPGAAAALSTLDGLAATRSAVDSGGAVRGLTFGWYTERIRTLNQLDLGLSESSDRTVSNGAEALRALADAKEAAARLRGLLNGVFAAGHFVASEYAQFAAVRAERDAALNTFRRRATPEQRAQGEAALGSATAAEAAGYESIADRGYSRTRLGVAAPAWWAAMTRVVDDLRAVQQAVGADVRTRATALRDQATLALTGLTAVAVLCVAGGVALAMVAARAITRPLALIAAEADDVASRRLPDAVRQAQAGATDAVDVPPAVQIPQRATTEMRSMAQALERVQDTAYALASEQAILRRNTTESLANLGRRNQNLLRRQLGFISRLEGAEPDPTALANLFELDHLATRMRRNAESLLVLVGEVSPRRWSAPVPLADVIRAAIAEVEEYRRVSLRRLDDAHLSGACVAELAHILAELLENALAFSPPDIDVELYSRRTRDHYLIAVVDHGIGMTPAELTSSNARLRGDERFLVVPTRFLGHYVVGALAHRLGVTVELGPSPISGVTARVSVPVSLLAQPAAAGSGDPLPVSAVALPAETLPAETPPAGPVPGRWLLATQNELPTHNALRVDAGPVPDSPPALPDQPLVSHPTTHTRNGLVRRVRRSTDTDRPAWTAHGDAAPPAVDRGPAEVSAMLTSFVAGTQRGNHRGRDLRPPTNHRIQEGT